MKNTTTSTDTNTQVSNDPYDPKKIIRFGEYMGQMVDSSEKRPAEILNEDTTSIRMANFRHLGQFWIATVLKGGVDQVVFRIDRFPTTVPLVKPAHTLLAFRMKAGCALQLTPQAPADGSAAQPTTADAFYFSVDYMAPKGVEYGLVPGLKNTFLATERFLSVSERAATEKADPQYPSDSLPLTLDQETKDNLLEKAIRQSNARREDDIYNTFEFNCTTELFKLLDSVIDYGHEVKPFVESLLHILDPVAGPSHEALKERGIVAADAKTPDWINP